MPDALFDQDLTGRAATPSGAPGRSSGGADHVVFLVSVDGTVRYASPLTEQLGIVPAEVTGRSLRLARIQRSRSRALAIDVDQSAASIGVSPSSHAKSRWIGRSPEIS